MYVLGFTPDWLFRYLQQLQQIVAPLASGVDFTNMLSCSFYAHRSQKMQKKTAKSSVSICAFGIFVRKSYS